MVISIINHSDIVVMCTNLAIVRGPHIVGPRMEFFTRQADTLAQMAIDQNHTGHFDMCLAPGLSVAQMVEGFWRVATM